MDVGLINQQALLDLFGQGQPVKPMPAVNQPGQPAPGGYDAPVRIEAARSPNDLSMQAPTDVLRQPIAKPKVQGAGLTPKMKPPSFGGR